MSKSYDILANNERSVIAMNARISNGTIQTGILGINSTVRLNLSADRDVTLLDEDSNPIGVITLSPEMKGDRNGYINDVTLKLKNYE